MTRTISLIAAIVGAALVFAVPSWGNNWAANKHQPVVVASQTVPFDARSDGLNRIYGLGAYSTMLDSYERTLAEKTGVTSVQPVAGFDARSDGLNRQYGLGKYAPATVADDRSRIDPSSGRAPVSVTQGRDVEWPEIGIGIGIGIGIAFALALLATKATRQQPIAH